MNAAILKNNNMNIKSEKESFPKDFSIGGINNPSTRAFENYVENIQISSSFSHNADSNKKCKYYLYLSD